MVSPHQDRARKSQTRKVSSIIHRLSPPLLTGRRVRSEPALRSGGLSLCRERGPFSRFEIGARSVVLSYLRVNESGGGVMMKPSFWNSCFLVLILLAQTVTLTRTQDQATTCDPRCLTKDCDAEGNCRCNSNNGNLLTFHGGQFCDLPSHYCSNIIGDPFYCVDNEGNSTCGSLNDVPTCICHPGYAGDKCQFNGTNCGVGFCFNNGTCNTGGTCDCPAGWQGNANCTLETVGGSSDGNGIKWWGGLLIAGAVVAVVSVGVVFGLKKYKERKEGVNRFNELKKSQMRGRAESDDDEYDSDPYEDEVSKNDKKAATTTTTTAQP